MRWGYVSQLPRTINKQGLWDEARVSQLPKSINQQSLWNEDRANHIISGSHLGNIH